MRKIIDRAGSVLPLPNVNPDVLSGMSVLTSMLFLAFTGFSMFLSFVFLIATLFLDWFDGLIARKYGKSSETGYITDTASDRFSEGIIFSAFFFPWFYLFALNCLLSIISVAKKRHFILPLRQIFLVFYAFLLFF